MRPTGRTKSLPRPMRGSDTAGRRGDGGCGQAAGSEDVGRARATERRADECFSARMGSSPPSTHAAPLVVQAKGNQYSVGGVSACTLMAVRVEFISR